MTNDYRTDAVGEGYRMVSGYSHHREVRGTVELMLCLAGYGELRVGEWHPHSDGRAFGYNMTWKRVATTATLVVEGRGLGWAERVAWGHGDYQSVYRLVAAD